MNKAKFQIMDTTLRDGEQTNGISFNKDEKLLIAKKLLTEVKVTRVEVTSAYVSAKEKEALSLIMDWAIKEGFEDNIEILSFVDHKKSVYWAAECKCSRLNLLTKGSKNHCENQLKKTAKEHLADIEKTVKYAKSKGMKLSVYLEDWSNGIKNSPEYVWQMLDAYSKMPFERVYLTDTLGIFYPTEVYEYVRKTVEKYPNLTFEFHGHNDYGLATINSLEAVRAGAKGLHTTINGLGERAGNTTLCEVIANLHDNLNIKTTVNESKFKDISYIVEAFSGKRIQPNAPINGSDVFTQTAGIHADGDKKGKLYETKLAPERFGRNRVYALGKLSGKSNIDMNLKKLGINLTEEQRKVLLDKIVKLGDNKKTVTPEDIPFLVSDLFEENKDKVFKIEECVITTSITLKPVAIVSVRIYGKKYENSSCGNGGYDAFMNALQKIATEAKINLPKLKDYEVHIPPGGKTNALVETTITWEHEDGDLKTHAVSSDQVIASLKATERMINLIYDKSSSEDKVRLFVK